MQHPYRVTADGLDIGPSTSYHRTPESAETAVLRLLRLGSPIVAVLYLRRPLVLFTTDPQVSLGVESICLLPKALLLTGEAAMNARHDAWLAAGSPQDPAGHPLLPRIDPPISKRIREDVARLGAAPALPRGKARRAVFDILRGLGLDEDGALTALTAINGYLK